MSFQKIPSDILENKEFKYCRLMEQESVYWFGSVSSTMDVAVYLIEDGITGIIVAEEQTSGRGRYGKKWFSPSGGLYCSWVMKAEERFPFFLSEVVALSLVETMRFFRIICNIRFPNDIISQGKKLAGILIERKEDFYNVGIGINVNNKVSCVESGISMNLILDRTIDEIEEVLKRFIICLHINKKNFSENENFYLKKWSDNLIK